MKPKRKRRPGGGRKKLDTKGMYRKVPNPIYSEISDMIKARIERFRAEEKRTPVEL